MQQRVLYFGILMLLAGLKVHSVQPQEELRSRLAGIGHLPQLIERWEAQNDRFLIPSIKEELLASAGQMSAMLCDPRIPNFSDTKCGRLVGNDAAVYGVLSAHLKDVLINTADPALSLFARLADEIDVDMHSIGYPSHQPNRYRCTEIPARLAFGRLTLLARGRQISVPDGTSQVCSLPGDYIFAFVGLSDDEGRLDPQATGKATLSHTAQAKTGWKLDEETGRSEPPSQPGEAYTATFSWFCSDRAVRHETDFIFGATDVTLVSFAAQPFVVLQVVDTHGLLPAAAEESFVDLMVEAIRIWKAGCGTCRGSALVAILVDESIFVDARLLDATRSGAINEVDLDAALRKAASQLSNSMLNPAVASVGDALGLTPFQRLARSSLSHQSLCSELEKVKALSPRHRELHLGLCHGPAGTRAGEDPVTLKMTIGSDPRLCGDFVACGTVDEGVELNTSQYSFMAPFGKFGSEYGPGVNLEAVLLHEVGHWFGLPHLEEPLDSSGRTNVMGEVYSEAGFCLSQNNLRMLNSSTHLSWQHRMRGCSGLKHVSRTSQEDEG